MNSKKGQSTIEFLSTFAFVLAIVFFYVKMALNITNGYLMHYATFMGARAFLVYDAGFANQEAAAAAVGEEVFNTISSWAIGIEQGGKVQFNKLGDGSKPLYAGAWTQFKQKFSYSSLVGGTSLMTYISEAFLGREPTASECTQRICEVLNNAGITECDLGVTAVDNGC